MARQDNEKVDTIEASKLRLFIERIERLEEEKNGLGSDISDVYAEAKSHGYDTKIMRECVKLRAMETHTRQERDAVIATYRNALGMPFTDTPLGQYAEHLKEMDEQGIGVSISVGDGPATPLNETARSKQAA
jgi:uncharacterized protein (UPF0335 family)